MIVTGTQFGPYLIEDELGTGGMATVYAARDTRTDQLVALKVLHEHYAKDEGVRKRFIREGQITQQLAHPNIVPIHDFGEAAGRAYLAMQHMAGGSLEKYFATPRKVRWQATLHILKQLATPLDFAHSQGVIHRDLKLQNILLDDQRKPYISDFGIARMVDSTRLTATGAAIGTPSYMAPEQVTGTYGNIGPAADLYAFAVMAYLMLTGYFPFTADDPIQVLMKHINNEPPPPSEVNPALPEAVDAVLLRGLAKDPQARYDSATAFVQALHTAIGNQQRRETVVHTMVANPVPEIPTDVEALRRGKSNETGTAVQAVPRTRRMPMALVGLVAAGLLLVGMLALFSNSTSLEADMGDGDPINAVALVSTATPTHTPTPTELPTETPMPTLTELPTETPMPTDPPTTAPTEPTNAPPTLEPVTNQRAQAGQPVNLQIEAVDPEAAVLRHIAEGLPAGLSIHPTSGLITGTPQEDGIFNVNITVIDDERNAAEAAFQWLVDPAPDWPAGEPDDPMQPIEPIEPLPTQTPDEDSTPPNNTMPTQTPTTPPTVIPPTLAPCYFTFTFEHYQGGGNLNVPIYTTHEGDMIEYLTPDGSTHTAKLRHDGVFLVAPGGVWSRVYQANSLEMTDWEGNAFTLRYINGRLIAVVGSAGSSESVKYRDWSGKPVLVAVNPGSC